MALVPRSFRSQCSVPCLPSSPEFWFSQESPFWHRRLWASVLPSPTPQNAGPSQELLWAEGLGGRGRGWGGAGEPCSAPPPTTVSPQSVVRICCIRSFGHFVARLQGSILQFSAEAGIFVSIAQSEQEGVLPQAQAQIRMVSRPASLPACSASHQAH